MKASVLRIIAGLLAASAAAPVIAVFPILLMGLYVSLSDPSKLNPGVAIGGFLIIAVFAVVRGAPIALAASLAFAVPGIWIGRRFGFRSPAYFALVGIITIVGWSTAENLYYGRPLKIPITFMEYWIYIAGAGAGLVYWRVSELPARRVKEGPAEYGGRG